METKPWDWKRILIGEAPPEFLVEVVIRTVIVYLLLLIVVRLMGKRLTGQISITEFAVVITLGAIVSPAMQLPDRAILFSVIALAVVYILHHLINSVSTRWEKAAKIAEGQLTCLVKNGILQVDAMKHVGISRQELFAELRKENIELLSNVDRVYMEACGLFTIFQNAEGRPGLLVFPEKDKEMMQYRNAAADGLSACSNCGNVQTLKGNDRCENCGRIKWIKAYV